MMRSSLRTAIAVLAVFATVLTACSSGEPAEDVDQAAPPPAAP